MERRKTAPLRARIAGTFYSIKCFHETVISVFREAFSHFYLKLSLKIMPKGLVSRRLQRVTMTTRPVPNAAYGRLNTNRLITEI